MIFDAGDHVADLSTAQRVLRRPFRRKKSHLLSVVAAAGRHEREFVPACELPVDYPHECHHANIRVKPGIDDQRFQRRIRLACGRGNVFDDLRQQIGHIFTRLRADPEGTRRVNTDDFLDFFRDPIRVGSRQIDLVQHRQHFQIELHGGIAICNALRFDTLGCIHHQHCPFASRQRSRYFVRKIDVPRRIDNVELVGGAVFGEVIERDSLCLDRDPALAFEVHRI